MFDLLAQVRFRIDNSNQPVFDLKNDICSFFDVFLEDAGGLDRQVLSTVASISKLAGGEYELETYGTGGFGVRLTCSMTRISSLLS